jgi:hypothetical protein
VDWSLQSHVQKRPQLVLFSDKGPPRLRIPGALKPMDAPEIRDIRPISPIHRHHRHWQAIAGGWTDERAGDWQRLVLPHM